jgi:hypothetical protein
MSDGIIVQPFSLAGRVLAVGGSVAIDSAFPVTNLLDPQPKTVVQTQTAGAGAFSLTIDFDFGADVLIDTIAVLFCALSADGAWQINSATSAQGASYLDTAPSNFVAEPFGVTPTTTTTRRNAIWAGAARTLRFLRIGFFESATAGIRVIRIGNIVIGKRLALQWNFELGSGRRLEDQSVTRTLPGGETAVQRGGRTPLFRATWSNISDAEMRAVWSTLLDVGTSAPILICEDPDATAGQNERLHYGLLTGLDFSERVQQDKQRIDLTIREMT